MKAKVEVKVHKPGRSPEMSTDDYLGASHAEHGQPIQVTVWSTPNSSFSHHLSVEQAEALYEQLGAALGKPGREKKLVAALETIAQQPFDGEVIGYGPERTEAFRLGFNTALGRVYTASLAALAEVA